jgi:hypothetical protein
MSMLCDVMLPVHNSDVWFWSVSRGMWSWRGGEVRNETDPVNILPHCTGNNIFIMITSSSRCYSYISYHNQIGPMGVSSATTTFGSRALHVMVVDSYQNILVHGGFNINFTDNVAVPGLFVVSQYITTCGYDATRVSALEIACTACPPGSHTSSIATIGDPSVVCMESPVVTQTSASTWFWAPPSSDVLDQFNAPIEHDPPTATDPTFAGLSTTLSTDAPNGREQHAMTVFSGSLKDPPVYVFGGFVTNSNDDSDPSSDLWAYVNSYWYWYVY